MSRFTRYIFTVLTLSLIISCAPRRNADGTLKVVPILYRNLGNNICSAAKNKAPILKKAVTELKFNPAQFNQFAKLYKNAPRGKSELDSLAEKIVKNLQTDQATVATAPVKGLYRSLEKVAINYSHDSSQIKDLIRNTIVTPKSRWELVKKMLKENNAIVSETLADSDPLGYSGINSKFFTVSGIWGEIQANTPAMIFAKENEETASAILGAQRYKELKLKAGDVKPGLGHEYYEKWRAPGISETEKAQIERDSIAYYKEVRKRLE